jgi:hypothetical protein
VDRGQLGSGAEPGAVAGTAGRGGLGVPGLATWLVRAVPAGRPGRTGDTGTGRRGRSRAGRRGRRGTGRAGAHRARHRCAQGTVHQAYRHRRDHLVPAVQRAGCGLGPGRADHPGRGGRRRVAGDGAEGLVDRSGDRGLRAAAGPHRRQRAQAPRHHLPRTAHAPAGYRGAPAAADERACVVQRGFPGPGRGPGRLPDRRAGRRLDGRAVDPRARAPSRRIPARPGAGRCDRAGLAGGDRGADRGQRAAQVVPAAGRPARSGHRPGNRARPGRRPAGAPGDRPAGGAGLVSAVDGRACRRRAGGGPAARAGRLAGQAGQQRHRPAGGAGPRADRRAARHAGRARIAAGRDDRRDLPLRAGHLHRRRHRPDPADDHRRADPRPAQGARPQPESALPRGAP